MLYSLKSISKENLYRMLSRNLIGDASRFKEEDIREYLIYKLGNRVSIYAVRKGFGRYARDENNVIVINLGEKFIQYNVKSDSTIFNEITLDKNIICEYLGKYIARSIIVRHFMSWYSYGNIESLIRSVKKGEVFRSNIKKVIDNKYTGEYKIFSKLDDAIEYICSVRMRVMKNEYNM